MFHYIRLQCFYMSEEMTEWKKQYLAWEKSLIFNSTSNIQNFGDISKKKSKKTLKNEITKCIKKNQIETRAKDINRISQKGIKVWPSVIAQQVKVVVTKSETGVLYTPSI